jgi:hypothetical protein
LYAFHIHRTYIGDYPEQILVALVKSGTCPICPAPRGDIGNWDSILEPRNTEEVIDALNSIDKGAAEFTKACADAGIKPVQCVFCKDLPFINIYSSITPDILHQLYKVFSSILFRGLEPFVEMLRLMLGVVAYLQIIISDFS